MNQPNLVDYYNFLINYVGVPVADLPDDSLSIQFTFNYAVYLCSDLLVNLPGDNGFMYCTAVYNLGAHLLMVYGQDLPGQDYFTNARIQYQLNSLVAGPVISASDAGTQSTLKAPAFFKDLTFSNLQQMQTPWGRNYLSIVQQIGSLSLLILV